MATLFFSLVLVSLLSGGLGQDKPAIPNTFQANVTVEYEGGKGSGTIVTDGKAKKSRETLLVCDDAFVTNYIRPDLGKEYFFYTVGPTDGCFGLSVEKNSMPVNWDWVSSATKSDEDFRGLDLQVYTQSLSNTTYRQVAVMSSDINRPYFIRVIDIDTHITVIFDTFSTTGLPPGSEYFDPPSTCTKSSWVQTSGAADEHKKDYFPFSRILSAKRRSQV